MRPTWPAALFGACALGAVIAAFVPAARTGSLTDFREFTAFAGALGVPQAIDWKAKNAYLKCALAIDGWLSWPAHAEDARAAMRMCANEAVLSADRDRRLKARLRSMSGCEAP